MQVFELVDRLTEIVGDPREIAGVADFPDDVLLWRYFFDDAFADLRPLLRRLIALQPYGCVSIARFEDRPLCEALPTRGLITKLREIFFHNLLGCLHGKDGLELPDGPLRRWTRALGKNVLDYRGPFHIHLTTDKRKSGRRILFSVIGADETPQRLSQGQDRFYVVAALMSEVGLTKREATILRASFEAALSTMTRAEVEAVHGGDDAVKTQLALEI